MSTTGLHMWTHGQTDRGLVFSKGGTEWELTSKSYRVSFKDAVCISAYLSQGQGVILKSTDLCTCRVQQGTQNLVTNQSLLCYLKPRSNLAVNQQPEFTIPLVLASMTLGVSGLRANVWEGEERLARYV